MAVGQGRFSDGLLEHLSRFVLAKSDKTKGQTLFVGEKHEVQRGVFFFFLCSENPELNWYPALRRLALPSYACHVRC